MTRHGAVASSSTGAFDLDRSLILVGDVFYWLGRLPTGQFGCCVTSPPYWGLRDYGIEHQIGSEADLEVYVETLRRVFREVRRVLRSDGTLWLNIGDAYTSGNRRWRDSDKKNPARAMEYRPPTPKGLKPKDLIGIPWRVALALQADGWYLRSDIIWYKPNCQPESVKDRPTRAHEYLFMFSKDKDYYYDRRAVAEAASDGNGTKNRRSVWAVNTEPFPEAHFATFPVALIEPCIAAGTKDEDFVLDPFFGSGTVGLASQRLHRRFVGVELNPKYAEMSYRRLTKDAPLCHAPPQMIFPS